MKFYPIISIQGWTLDMDVANIIPGYTGYKYGSNNGGVIPHGKKSQPAAMGISDFSRSLYKSNLDIANSVLNLRESNFTLSFQFLRQTEQKVSLNGYVSKDFTSGSLSFSYDYIQSEVKDGKTTNKEFKVDFNLSFSSLNSTSVKTEEKKEDILDFIRRITKEIFSKLSDGKTSISAIILDPEDLKDIAQLADKKIVQLIYQLIEMIKYAAEAKMMSNKNKAAQDIVYQPERIKQEVLETEKTSQLNVNYSFSIKEVGNTEVASLPNQAIL